MLLSSGRGGTGGGGEPPNELEMDLPPSASLSEICDCSEQLSGVVIMLVDVRTLSGDVTTPGLV